jgi:two-component system, OmpR family, response regulator PhoP
MGSNEMGATWEGHSMIWGDFKSDAGITPLVYLIDDDRDFREEMIFGLSRLGLDAHGFHSAADFYRAYATRPSDIVVVDISLEGEDGLSIATHLRASGSVGIIMATARSAVDDRVNGLRHGADAYLVKPVDVRELAATVHALNQRLHTHQTPSPSPIPRWALVEGGWVLSDGLGNRLRLTTLERRFLARLFDERGQTVERPLLVEAMGEDIHDFNYARLDTIASRLRRKAEKSNMIIPLHAIRGLGFAFAD